MDPQKLIEELTTKLAAATAEAATHKQALEASGVKNTELAKRCEAMGGAFAKLAGISFDEWSSQESAEHDKQAEEAKALAALKATALQITGATEIPAAVGALTKMSTEHAALVAAKADADAKALKALDGEFDAALDGAVKEGKLPPALKPTFVSLKASLGTPKALEALKAAIPAEPIVALRAPGGGERHASDGSDNILSDPDYAEAASRVGIPVKDISDFVASQRAQR